MAGPKKWTDDEEMKLLKDGKVDGRSDGACAIRKKVIALRMTTKGGMTEEEASAKCGVSVDDIKEQQKIESAQKRKGGA
eukprot:gene6051-45_t